MTEQDWESTPKRWREHALQYIHDSATEEEHDAESFRELASLPPNSTHDPEHYARSADHREQLARALRAAARRLGEA